MGTALQYFHPTDTLDVNHLRSKIIVKGGKIIRK